MKVGDRVLVEAVITSIGGNMVAVAISRDGHPQRVEHVRTCPSQVRTIYHDVGEPEEAAA